MRKEIEEAKKHPLWEDFCLSYEKAASVHPNKSEILILVITYWQIFMDGAEAGTRTALSSLKEAEPIQEGHSP